MEQESSLKSFLNNLLPFIAIGMGIALAIVLIKLLLVVAAWGIIIGLVLYAGVWLKEKIFPNHQAPDPAKGRIIEGEAEEMEIREGKDRPKD